MGGYFIVTDEASLDSTADMSALVVCVAVSDRVVCVKDKNDNAASVALVSTTLFFFGRGIERSTLGAWKIFEEQRFSLSFSSSLLFFIKVVKSKM